MGSGGNKKKEQANYWDNAARQSYTQAQQPSELQQRLDAQALEVLNFGDTPGKDVRDLKSMAPYLDLAGQARNRANSEQMPTGALALGGQGAEGHSKLLQNQRQKEYDQDAGAMVEDAFAGVNANAHGWGGQSAQLTQNRQLGLFGAASQNWNQAQGRANQPGFWSQMAQGLVSGGLGGASAGPLRFI